MSSIAFLGLGAMGSRMAVNLLRAGHTVTVWNRDPAKAEALVKQGATFAPSPRAAAADKHIVISMVRDDEASQQVWLHPDSGALHSMKPGSLAIECSTLTPSWIEQLAESAHERQIGFVDAPLAGSRPQADAAQLIFFVGGTDVECKLAEPILKAMGSAVHHAGEVGAGAKLKLAVNALFGIQVAAMAEIVGVLKAQKMDLPRAVEIMSATPVMSMAAKGAAASMLSGNFPAMFPVELVEKDFGYVNDAATSVGQTVPMADEVRSIMQKAIEAGLGEQNLTSIVRLYE